MKVSLLQYDIAWMDINTNLRTISDYLETLNEQIDLLVLPEMFLTGFNMDAESSAIIEEHEAIQELIDLASKYNTGIIGSLAIKEGLSYYNRVLLLTANGIHGRYDKQYLFSPSGENETFSQKHPTTIIEFRGWKILPQVCYDLRFPESVRSVGSTDLIIYMANWPVGRIHHWDSLLKARAIENQCYTIGCNRVGTDENGWIFPGHSQIIAPNGTVTQIESESIDLLANPDIDHLKEYRIKYPFWRDKK